MKLELLPKDTCAFKICAEVLNCELQSAFVLFDGSPSQTPSVYICLPYPYEVETSLVSIRDIEKGASGAQVLNTCNRSIFNPMFDGLMIFNIARQFVSQSYMHKR